MANHDEIVSWREFCFVALLSALLSLNLNSCAPPSQDFPLPNATILHNSEDFDEIRRDLEEFQHRDFQLAGRIIRTHTSPTGVIFLAEWLPFPHNTFAGPEAKSTGLSFRRIAMHFPGTVDHDGRRKGNEFLMAGTLTPVPESVDYRKIPTSIPHFSVQCLHVWKTAGDDLAEYIWMDPFDDRYPPPLEDTYCVAPNAL